MCEYFACRRSPSRAICVTYTHTLAHPNEAHKQLKYTHTFTCTVHMLLSHWHAHVHRRRRSRWRCWHCCCCCCCEITYLGARLCARACIFLRMPVRADDDAETARRIRESELKCGSSKPQPTDTPQTEHGRLHCASAANGSCNESNVYIYTYINVNAFSSLAACAICAVVVIVVNDSDDDDDLSVSVSCKHV